jgi:hypothetical protein
MKGTIRRTMAARMVSLPEMLVISVGVGKAMTRGHLLPEVRFQLPLLPLGPLANHN